MRHSKLFLQNLNSVIEREACEYLNRQKAEFHGAASHSPRAVGDIAQVLVADNFESFVPKNTVANYSKDFARRAMADLAFEDTDGYYYVIDVKTHRTSSNFNMPNLTSVERLARFYEDDRNYFVVMMLVYDISEGGVQFERVNFVPIEFLDWSCLTLGALGWGQIQIANSNRILIQPMFSRKKWVLQLCDYLLEFYPKEIAKIGKRITYFEQVKMRWQARED
jgi:hypothetical protein